MLLIRRRNDSPVLHVPGSLVRHNFGCSCLQLFLEEGRYQSPQECQALGMRKDSKLKFHRSINRSKQVLYQVRPCSGNAIRNQQARQMHEQRYTVCLRE